MSYERLTDQQKNDILEAYKNGMPIKEMEEKFSINNVRINRLVRKHNLEKRNKNRIRREPIIMELWNNGEYDIDVIAEKAECTKDTVLRALRKNNAINRKYDKLPYDKIMILLKDGKSITEISNELNLNYSSVLFAVNKSKEKEDEFKVKKKERITIKVGDFVSYKYNRLASSNSQYDRVAYVEKIENGFVICRHESGFISSFTKTELSLMFSKGVMKLLDKEITK